MTKEKERNMFVKYQETINNDICDLFITYRTIEIIINDITFWTRKDETHPTIRNLINYKCRKLGESIAYARNKLVPYNFIPISRVISLVKDIIGPPFSFSGNLGYSQIKNSPSILIDLAKEDSRKIQKLLFDIVGPHHWGICKLFILNIYPNHCSESLIDSLYFSNRKSLLESEDGFFSLKEGVSSDKLLLSNKNRKKWVKSLVSFYSKLN